MTGESSRKRDLLKGVMAGLLVAATSAAGQLATYPNLSWYQTLEKPSFTPPDALFAPVWTTLYVLMAYAFWRILRLPPSGARRIAIFLFLAQLVLNAAWSWAFFGAHNPLWGLIEIVPQLLLIIATFLAFRRLDRVAGWCLVPLIAWVAYATALNAEILRLNG